MTYPNSQHSFSHLRSSIFLFGKEKVYSSICHVASALSVAPMFFGPSLASLFRAPASHHPMVYTKAVSLLQRQARGHVHPCQTTCLHPWACLGIHPWAPETSVQASVLEACSPHNACRHEMMSPSRQGLFDRPRSVFKAHMVSRAARLHAHCAPAPGGRGFSTSLPSACFAKRGRSRGNASASESHGHLPNPSFW